MRKLTLTQIVPLDGVVWSPDGGPAEDPSGGASPRVAGSQGQPVG
jgi:hypothetical protein